MPRAIGQRTPFSIVKNEGTAQYHIWRSIRFLRRFTVVELAATVTRSTFNSVHSYVKCLRQAGYLATEAGKAEHRRAIYRLVRNTGPLAPELRRRDRAVYDPNIETVFPRSVA